MRAALAVLLLLSLASCVPRVSRRVVDDRGGRALPNTSSGKAQGKEPPVQPLAALAAAEVAAKPSVKDPPPPPPKSALGEKRTGLDGARTQAPASQPAEAQAKPGHNPFEGEDPPKREASPAGARPDSEPLSGSSPGPKDQSPATLTRKKTPHRPIPLIGLEKDPPDPPGEIDEGAAAALPSSTSNEGGAPAPDIQIADLVVGSFRVQVAKEGGKKSGLILDKTYTFADKVELYNDLEAAGAETGHYWVRIAYIDLLDFQHPYTRPRRYKFTNLSMP
jgi:hypothetical protein